MIFLNCEEELIWKDELQVLFFNSTWMPLNNKNLLMLQKVSKKYQSIQIFVIDIDYFSNLCRRFDISIIPSILVMRNGKEIGRVEENLKTRKLISFFNDIYANDRSNRK